MTHRAFERSTDKWNGVERAVWRISCSHAGCEKSSVFNAATRSRLVNPVVAADHFRRNGWSVGNGPRHDLCPTHSKRQEAPKVVHIKPTPVPPALKVLSPSEAPPRVMGRDDRRLVFAKISEVYLGEGNGYCTGWSDERVGIDLNIPRAWVTEVRDELFGPAVPDVDVAEFRAELAKITEGGAQLAQVLAGLNAEIDALTAMQADLTARRGSIARTHTGLLTDIARLTAMGARIEKALGK